MKVNYFLLWNYNKFPFVYSIMNKDERNVVIINMENSQDLKDEFVKLEGLERIEKVILVNNTVIEYVYNILYRILIYPFRRKSEEISFYLDGFTGYYPIYLANMGVPDSIYFYEEGESIYQKERLFKKMESPKIRQFINDLIKSSLFIKKSTIRDIKSFFVRDKKRMLNVVDSSESPELNFEIIEVDDVSCIRDVSESDKVILKNIFFPGLQMESLFKDVGVKKAIVLTQPIYLCGVYTNDQAVELFDFYIQKLKAENYKVYLKLHPLEKIDSYITDDVERLNGKFPFELLALFDVEFDKGLTYNSTAINSRLIKSRILIADCLKKSEN